MKKVLTSLTALAIIVTAMGIGTANAEVVYLEDFEGESNYGTAGWTAVRSDGTSRTSDGLSMSSNWNYGLNSTNSAYYKNDDPMWLVSDAPLITVALDEVTWLDRRDDTVWRLGLEVGGSWYLSDELTASVTSGTLGVNNPATATVSDFSTGFAAWSGAPADDSTAWDDTFTGTLGTAGALPTGDVTRLGLMLVTGADGSFDDVTVTAIPEPASLALLGLGGLALLSGRRRRRS